MSELVHTIEVLGRAVAQWSWQLAIFLGVLWLVVRLDRRHRPEFRYHLWTFALIASLCLPWALQGIATYSWTIRAREVWTDPHGFYGGWYKGINRTGPQILETRGTSSSPQYPGRKMTHSSLPSSTIVYGTLGFLWVLGIAVAATRKVRRNRTIQAIVKRSKPFSATPDSSLPILLSREVSNPLLHGLFRPVILLPHDIEEWSTSEERAAVIRHEGVHFKKKHHWVATLEALATTVLFFHPLVRWMCKQLDLERELVCDAEIVRRGAHPNKYAETLLLVAGHAISGDAGVYFAAKAELNRRIDLLFRPLRRERLALSAVPVILLTPLLTLGFWQSRAEKFDPIESEWLTTFLPVVPEEVPLAMAFTSSPSAKPLPRTSRQEQVNPAPQQPVSPRFQMVVSLFKGQETRGSEVHIALGIPHSGLVFSRNEGALATLRADGTVEMRIQGLSGRVVTRSEEPFQVSFPLSRPIPADGLAVLEKVFQLEPGAYVLFVGVTDSTTGNFVGLVERRLEIPALRPTLHSTSSLILADYIDNGNPRNSSPFFRVGDIRVRPNFTGKLRRDQELKLVQQVYNPASSSLTYETLLTTSGREVKRIQETLATEPEVMVIKTFPLSGFVPGSYEVQTMVTDSKTGLKVGARAQFSVE